MAKHIEIKGVTYEVIRRETPDEVAERGYYNVAEALREAGAIAQYYLKRPRGHTGYFAIQYRGWITEPLSLGRIV